MWCELRHDAVQDISYEGILRCWEEGERLLGAPYRSALVSVHDPDEYLAGARGDAAERARRIAQLQSAYRALEDLRRRRRRGPVAVGLGAKDWRVARELADLVRLDWVMLACSLTVRTHPRELRSWVAQMAARGVRVINSAIFHGGFLTGGEFYDYRRVDPATARAPRSWPGARPSPPSAAAMAPPPPTPPCASPTTCPGSPAWRSGPRTRPASPGWCAWP